MDQTELIEKVGAALYGPDWSKAQLAFDLGMSERHLRRLANGSVPLTDGIRDDLLKLCIDASDEIDAARKALSALGLKL